MSATIVLDERYQMLPSMPPEQFEALKADIAERGVLVPIDVTEDGYILDGHHRYRACVELCVTDFPTIVRPGLDEQDRRLFARNNNMLRRHLTRAQIRQLIAAQLRDTPDWANNRIAQALGVDKKTVMSQRRRLESTGEIPKLTDLVGADGKQRRAKRPAAIMAPNALELAEILNRLQSGGADLSGFLSAHGMVLMGAAPDPFADLKEEEKREWLIAAVDGMHPERIAWIRRKDFRTLTEFYGPEGQRWMQSLGLFKPSPGNDPAKSWATRLAEYDTKTVADLEAMLTEAAP